MTLVVPFEEIFQNEVGLLAKHPSWHRVNLDFVATVQNGFAFSSSKFSKDKGIPLIRIRDLQRSKTETLFNGSYDEAFVVNGGDTLVGMDGNFNCVLWQGGKALLNQRVCRIIPNTEFIDPTFLRLTLQGYLLAIQRATSSTTVGHLSSNDIKRIPLPLPPLNEQKRIVAKLDELLPKVEACKERLQKIPTILKRFRQSVLAAAVSGKLTEEWRRRKGLEGYSVGAQSEYDFLDLPKLPEGWSWAKLEDLTEAQGGNAFKSTRFLKTGFNQVLRIGNVKNGRIDLGTSPVFISDEDADEFSRYRVQQGDLLISLTGTKYKRDYGFVCAVPSHKGKLYLNQRVGRLRANSKVLSEFLILWLSTDWYRNFFFFGETGNVNQGNVGMDALKSAPCALPSLEEQAEIVRLVNLALGEVKELYDRVVRASNFTERLGNSILGQAFLGSLVSQDPTDEPASALLERIKASSASTTNGSKPKSSRKQKNHDAVLLA